jgi:hypothetical protein
MPVRRRAVEFLGYEVHGGLQFDGRNGSCVTIPTEEFEAGHDAADELWCRLVEHVDWSRALLDAAGRHIRHLERLDEGEDTSRSDLFPSDLFGCGECLRDALLVADFGASPDEPITPAPGVEDWLGALTRVRELARAAKLGRKDTA